MTNQPFEAGVMNNDGEALRDRVLVMPVCDQEYQSGDIDPCLITGTFLIGFCLLGASVSAPAPAARPVAKQAVSR